ncbi:GTPase regulator, putative, partial [Eimeria tenella]
MPFGCRVDVGCTDTLGFLHVRDMHYLPRALKAGASFLNSLGATGAPGDPQGAPAGAAAGAPAGAPEDPAGALGEAPEAPAGAPKTLTGAPEALSGSPGAPLGAPGAPSGAPGAPSVEGTTEGWIKHAGDVLRVGDALCVHIKSIDREGRRMRLTTVPSPATAKGHSPRKPVEAFWVGQEVEGIVLRCTEFGLFLDIGAVEDAFLHANEVGRENICDDVQELFRRFKKSRGARGRRCPPADPLGPQGPPDGGPAEALGCRTGDTLRGLRVLEIDASRSRIQLTTRCEAEVQRLQQWKQQMLQMQVGVPPRESPEEKFARIGAALKLLERHRKKQQKQQQGAPGAPGGPPAAGVVVTPPQRHSGQGAPTEKQLQVLFPGYTAADVEEALSLLEAEKRRKELLLLQEQERRARKRHPRFQRRSADDLSLQEARQLLKEESGLVTPEMLQQDARQQALRAGLAAAEVPVFGPDGLPKMQQVPLKNLLPSPHKKQPAAAARTLAAAAAAAGEPAAAAAEAAAAPGTPAAAQAAAPQAPAAAAAAAAAAGAAAAQAPEAAASNPSDSDNLEKQQSLEEELEVPAEFLQRELRAYGGPQEPGALGAPQAQGPGGPPGAPRAPLGAAEPPGDQGGDLSAAEVDSFFAKSEAQLLKSLKKGRRRRVDSATAAAEQEEVRELIQMERRAAQRALAGGPKGAPTGAPRGAPRRARREGPPAAAMEKGETLGEISESEVLETIKERLEEEPELSRELELRGKTPEGLAAEIQKILTEVTGGAPSSSKCQQPRRQQQQQL